MLPSARVLTASCDDALPSTQCSLLPLMCPRIKGSLLQFGATLTQASTAPCDNFLPCTHCSLLAPKFAHVCSAS